MSRFILYARKSSESEDRQILSIDSQIRELEQHARDQGLDIIDVMSEARSAKSPGRPVFAKMLKLISKGQADGIICWKLDRLARNPIDGGALIWSIDEGKIEQIVTRERAFLNTGNDKFWMQLEFGMAKKYVDDLSDNVKRGIRAKLAQGWLPHIPPIGYLNDVTNKTIVPDPERFRLVRKIWDFVLAGRPPAEVLAVATEAWGLRTRRSRRRGGVKLSRTMIYELLGNTFYYGLIPWNGDTYHGIHKPMITKDEFDRVQVLLGRVNPEPRVGHRFAFTGLLRCGECGCSITATEVSKPSGARYTYYYCTKRQNHVSCSQRTTRAESLDAQIVETLSRLRIDEKFKEWALGRLTRMHEHETAARQDMNRSLDQALRHTEGQVDALLGLRLRGMLTDEEFLGKKRELSNNAVRLKEQLADADSRTARWYKLAEKALRFAETAQSQFSSASIERRRDILITLGTNFTLRDRRLRIQLEEPFKLLEGTPSRRLWSGIADGIQTFFKEHPTRIRWPEFADNDNDATAV